MDPLLIMIIGVVAIALIFDFLNGFHDSANAIATIVITRTLTPAQAVIMAGAAEFLGYFIGGTAVAAMVGKGIINLDVLGGDHNTKLLVVLSALVGAVAWNILTWLLGLPSSSSHALFGGLIGSMVMAVGWKGLAWSQDLILFTHTYADKTKVKWGVFNASTTSGWESVAKTVLNKDNLPDHVEKSVGLFVPSMPSLPYDLIKIIGFIFIAPLLSMFCAAVVTTLVIWCFRRVKPATAGKIFKKLQLVSAAWYCTGHGRNDAQKTMGVIALALLAGGYTVATPQNQLPVDPWVILSCYSAIAIGTMFGGWRIVKTMGTKITKIRPMEGFCAETSAGLVLLGTAELGMPCSTTHVISGSIMGVGAVERAAKVRWVTARTILWAWILTIPLTAVFTAGVYLVVKALVTPLL